MDLHLNPHWKSNPHLNSINFNLIQKSIRLLFHMYSISCAHDVNNFEKFTENPSFFFRPNLD